MDVDDIDKQMQKFRKNNVKIAMEPTKISVGIMARIIDLDGVNIVLIQHEK
nr:hypothetical protein [uncultured Methanobrevibacter sp.]